MTYEQALAYLASLAVRGWRLGLDRMEEFVRLAGLADALGPPNGPRFIHIAGTNGKGTTTAFTQNILKAHGYKVGGFFSPYVYDIRERVQMNGDLISKADFARIVAQLQPIADQLSDTPFGGVTEFELKTAVGLRYWRERKAEWVALEVGLGGKLDSTNIVSPAACIIVSIGLDHVNILGDTLAKIAEEKAGVIKPGVPVVVGDIPREALERVIERADTVGAPVVLTPALDYELHPSIPGEHIRQNAILAVKAIKAAGVKLDPKTVQEAVRETRVPGRFQGALHNGKLFILDGAHNQESAALLSETVRRLLPKARISLIAGMVEGHDPERLFAELMPIAENIYLPPIDFYRAYPPAKLHTQVQNESAVVCDSIQDAVNKATSDGSDCILVTGSFYLVGEVGRYIGAFGSGQTCSDDS